MGERERETLNRWWGKGEMLNKRSGKEREKLVRREEQESDTHCTDAE